MKLEVSIEKRLGALALCVDFAVQGGITALFGRSGAGKTSILNAIAGLLRPDRGRIALDGEPLFESGAGIDVPAHRRRIGYVFQDGRLLPHLSVRQNLLYGARFSRKIPSFGARFSRQAQSFGARFSRPARPPDFDRIVALLALEPLLERRPHHLSGGEKQRVAIGRALLAAPRLLLMDEPLASLDAPRRLEILRHIERLRDALRIPILYVSHALDEVVRLADSLAVIEEGKLLDCGPLPETVARLAFDARLGRFEGGSVIEARVAEQDAPMGLARLDFAGGSLYAADVAACVGEQVRVQVLARDVSVARVRPEAISMLNVLAGTIRRRTPPHGASVDLEIDVSGTPLIARITRKSAEALNFSPGDRVYALIKAVAIHPGGEGLD